MNDLFGFSRNVVKRNYALLTPAGFVNGALPGWVNANCVTLISPAMGAQFCQLLITFNTDGHGEGNTGANEYFVYVCEGSGTVLLKEKTHRLRAGSYVYVPPETDLQFKGSDTRLLIFQKRFHPLPGHKRPDMIVAHESDVKGQPFLGNEDARLQVLLPDQLQFDLAVNIFTYQPGATLPFVESHIMEQGLMMLKGQGIYRLDADWHPVKEGDAIWMAPYCPQWFVAMGKTPAGYIYYKDVNRDPM